MLLLLGIAKKRSLLLPTACGLILIVLSWWLHFGSGATSQFYVPTFHPKSADIKIVSSVKNLRLFYSGKYDAALIKFSPDWTPSLQQSFLRVDRKQNLRLWPVVASGLIRSPPPVFF